MKNSKKISDLTFKVITMNIAHARKKISQQMTLQQKVLKNNLDEIAKMFRRENPVIIGLQEADGYSKYSRHFDHIEYISSKTKYSYFLQGQHVTRMFMNYGTALLSKKKINNPKSFLFDTSKILFPKGYVRGTFQLNKTIVIEVVSLHLDPVRKKIRFKQIEILINHLKNDKNPIVIMGDFNCNWKYQNSVLHKITSELNLSIYKPENKLITFPKSNKRLDWILISKELEFVQYKTIPDHLSDHRAVLAEIKVKG